MVTEPCFAIALWAITGLSSLEVLLYLVTSDLLGKSGVPRVNINALRASMYICLFHNADFLHLYYDVLDQFIQNPFILQ